MVKFRTTPSWMQEWIFLKVVDENSQENGRRFDSRNATHYFLPKFTSITIPKTSDPKYQEKLQSSLTGEFNRAQAEMGKQTISDFSARSWLNSERPKHAIYPHKVDYCDKCASFKVQIQTKQQIINRLMQTGEGSEEITQAKSEKAEIESSLQQHKESARKSLEMYRSVTDKCKNDWEKIA